MQHHMSRAMTCHIHPTINPFIQYDMTCNMSSLCDETRHVMSVVVAGSDGREAPGPETGGHVQRAGDPTGGQAGLHPRGGDSWQGAL